MKFKFPNFFLIYAFLLILNKAGANTHQDFIVFSPPKCGTHLIGKTLQLMLNEEPYYILATMPKTNDTLKLLADLKEQKKFLVAHNISKGLLDELVKKKYKIIFTLRDPRDQLISMMHFMRGGQWTRFEVAHISNYIEQIEELITGEQFGFRSYDRCIQNRLARVMTIPKKSVYFARFENYVGEKGGSTKETQLQELNTLAKFLKFELSPEAALYVGDNLFGGTWSFREGRIGQWKEYFTERHKKLYKKRYGDTLIHLGYERNKDW